MRHFKIILLGVMIVVFTFSINTANTYSAFTNSATSDLASFKTGSLKVMLNGNGENSQNIFLNYGKFGAGDSISRDFYIKNCGSLSFIFRLSLVNETNPIFNYLMCDVNIYSKENTTQLYRGALRDFTKSVATSLEIGPNESLKCELIITLPEDTILPEAVVKSVINSEAYLSSNIPITNESINIKVDATQVNNASYE